MPCLPMWPCPNYQRPRIIKDLQADIAEHDPKSVKERLSLRKRFTILKKNMEALLAVPYVISNEAKPEGHLP